MTQQNKNKQPHPTTWIWNCEPHPFDKTITKFGIRYLAGDALKGIGTWLKVVVKALDRWLKDEEESSWTRHWLFEWVYERKSVQCWLGNIRFVTVTTTNTQEWLSNIAYILSISIAKRAFIVKLFNVLQVIIKYPSVLVIVCITTEELLKPHRSRTSATIMALVTTCTQSNNMY